MSLYTKLSTFAAKIEATSGTAESLTSAEGVFNAFEKNIQQNRNVIQREAEGSFGKRASAMGGRRGFYDFKTELAWDGTSTLPKLATVLLPACGYVNSGGTFTPRSQDIGSNVKTVTLGKFLNGVYKVLYGASGNFTIVAKAGEPIMIEWHFEGIWGAVVDAALIAPTYPTDLPWRAASATTTYDALAWCAANLTFDSGNELYLEECINAGQGYSKVKIVDRVPTVTADPEAVTVATQDRYGMHDSSDENAFALTFLGTGGATIAINAPKAQIINIEEGERNKIAIDNITLQCNKNGSTADQDVSIVFTEAA